MTKRGKLFLCTHERGNWLKKRMLPVMFGRLYYLYLHCIICIYIYPYKKRIMDENNIERGYMKRYQQ